MTGFDHRIYKSDGKVLVHTRPSPNPLGRNAIQFMTPKGAPVPAEWVVESMAKNEATLESWTP